MKTDLVDKNGKTISVGDKLRTYDKTGKEWIGTVIVIPQHTVLKGRNPQFALMTNYATWLHPEHSALYEIVKTDRLSRKLDI